jgi:DNA-directed RNA polymerase subunit K/omega
MTKKKIIQDKSISTKEIKVTKQNSTKKNIREQNNLVDSDYDSISGSSNRNDTESIDLNSSESEIINEENMDEIDNEDNIDGDANEVIDEDVNDDNDDSDLDEDNLSEIDKDIPNDDGEDCMYRFKKKNKHIEDIFNSDVDEFDEPDDIFDDDINFNNEIYVKSEDRITKPNLTKYERVSALSIRTRQLASGAKPMVDNVSHLSVKEIAKLELVMKKMPLFIDRTLCSDQKERWNINELNIIN